jgi:hypothetical protein
MRFGEKFHFEVPDEKLEYGTKMELRSISRSLDKIADRHRPLAVLDLLKDMYKTSIDSAFDKQKQEMHS